MPTEARTVKVIPPTIQLYTQAPVSLQRRKRVAAYARVSTDFEEQLTSYEAQIDYYTRHIKENAEWDFVEVYTDEGISATSTKRREGFKRMIQDAIDGKIDLILTKSISRFARNTVDTLTYVRQLKESGVEVYFEKENIYTLDSKGELLITIMSSLAQEESRSLSENVTWGQRKRFADGKVTIPYKNFLGYRKSENGLPEIVEEEAETVRIIYGMFLDGKTTTGIAKYLTEHGIATPCGKARWQFSTVESILINEKYKGDALLQKTFCIDFLSKKMKVNEGEVPQYYVEGSHPAIVSRQQYDCVQEEIKRRKGVDGRYSGGNCFSSRIYCGDCGAAYGPKVWHSNDKYRRVIWQCNHKFSDGHKCSTPNLDETAIKAMFVTAFNQLLNIRDEVRENCALICRMLTDNSSLEATLSEQRGELEVLAGLIRQLVNENAGTALNQEEYQKRYDTLAARFEAAKEKADATAEKIEERKARSDKISAFLDALCSSDAMLSEFDETLWCSTVERVTVCNVKDIRFIFKDGSEIRV